MKKQFRFNSEVITRESDAGAHYRARVALGRFLPDGKDWDDVTVFTVDDKDRDCLEDGDLWATDDSGNVFVIKY